MVLDTRWKFPQGKTPEHLYDAIYQMTRELRKGESASSGGGSSAFIRPDDFTGTDSSRVQQAIEAGIDEGVGVDFGSRVYSITDPIVIPTVPFDAVGRWPLRIYSDGAVLQKASASNNDYVVATFNYVNNQTGTSSGNYAIFGNLTIDGAGIAQDGWVSMGGLEFVPAKFRVVDCTRYGLRKPATTANGSSYTGFGGGFEYLNLDIAENGDTGVRIEDAFYVDYTLFGMVYDNALHNLVCLSATAARIAVRSFFQNAHRSPLATQSAYFEELILADFSGSFFGCDERTLPGNRFTYSTTTTAADPGTGTLRFNNATLASATELYISETDALSGSIAAALTAWAGAGTRLTVAQEDNPTYVSFTVTGATDNGTWRTFTIGSVVAVGTLTNGQTVYIAPEARCAAEFVVGEGDVNVRGAQFQNGDCVVSFGASGFYQRAMVSACDFSGGASLRHATNNSAKAVYSAANHFENGAYRFQSGTGHAGIIEAWRDWNAGQQALAIGLQSAASTAVAVRRTVTGSRGGNAALASLLTGLASLGLITDSTSA